MLILVINSGSSSLKYQVREVPSETNAVLADGSIGQIGDGEIRDHTDALEVMAKELDRQLGSRRIDVVGHRVVHGGEDYDRPVLISPQVLETIERLSPLAPLHNPANAEGIRAIGKKWPDIPQVAVFDTAFHCTLPEHAWRYALPDELYREHGIRRYGFHGSSFEYVTGEAARLLGIPLGSFNAVIAHVGNGASATAISGGQSVDTSMGLTPLEGLVMGTRPGDLDPGLVLFLQQTGRTPDELQDLFNHESGLKALAGESDMRRIVEASNNDDAKAVLALEVASYRLAKYVGAYHVACGGAQALVFTAGVGEHSAAFRALAVGRLGALGITLDREANEAADDPQEACVISDAGSAIPVLVVPTDEEKVIAEAAAAVVSQRS